MSTTPYPGPYPTTISRIIAHHITTTPAPRHARPSAHLVSRRPTMLQGISLEKLGHAIEYLVDSQLLLAPGTASNDAAEAAQILMQLSRKVFAECREAAPASRLLQRLRSILTPGIPA